jgi:hypothetical protein
MKGGIEGKDLTLTMKEMLKYSLKDRYLILVARKKDSALLVVSRASSGILF